ncbi:MAG TPA: hypothetical protein VIV11_42680 [Kofleriaceae bacterium]
MLLIAIVFAGCTKQNPDFCPNHPDDPRCGGMIDGGVDGDGNLIIDAPDGGNGCVGSGVFEICPMGAATGTKMLSGPIDTNGTMCHSTQLWAGGGQTTSCFIVAAMITVQNVTVTGSRPLVLVASNEINVTGHLDAASHVSPASTGPGLPATPCGTFAAAPQSDSGAGGGAGASFAMIGGKGGNGGSGNNGAANEGLAYNTFLTAPPGLFRAGCDGQTGATGNGGGGMGGRGGGAVMLAAPTIQLGAAAIINASGAGGQQALKAAGGGGGGSGGMILMHATTFSITSGAIVLANGGSGSSGGDGNNSGVGVRGNDPNPTDPTTAAAGGDGVGGTGGNGFAGISLATAGMPGISGAGGGGGGGAGGYIQSNMPLTSASVSPAANVVP